MTVRTHTFRNGVYDIERSDLDGSCINYRKTSKEIWVSSTLTPPKELETWVHEAMHAAHPGMSEARVTRSASDIARLLWRLGYRRTAK